MVSFRPLEQADISTVRPFFEQSASRLCDCSSVLVMWRKFLSAEIAFGGDALYVKLRNGGVPAFMTPLGGDFYVGMETLLAYCRIHRCRPLFSAVAGDELERLRARYRIIRAEPMRDWFDYLYESRDLMELKGRRFHGQRNHISRFDREYPNHAYGPLTDTKAALAFIERYFSMNPPADGLGSAEREIVCEVLEKYHEYGQLGGVLTVDGEIVSVSVGEVVGDTLFVHIEKADTSYAGAYQKTVSLFAREYGGGARYINREEDMGIEGLRRSKLSYHPAALLEKYLVELAI
ncbi:MAG: phosphatidylglycerol lysyltransferase domain-containing protein [Oscillospiraceae bacterium]|jgi:hypothetical protein|nr:phosphatidylglycerol lysyltransferase domain-containing protein [Oscillospiraceae bacterium]